MDFLRAKKYTDQKVTAIVNRATDTDAMSRQAAIDSRGVDKGNLKARIDDDYNELSTQLNESIQVPETKTYVAAEGQTLLTVDEYTSGSLTVEVDNVPQTLGSGYTETNSTSITFSEPFDGGEVIRVTRNKRAFQFSEGVTQQLDSLSAQLAENAKKFDLLSRRIPFNEKIGIHMGDYLQGLVNAGTDTTTLSLMKQTGIKYVRVNLQWINIETSQGVYNFSAYDVLIQKIIDNGQIPLINLFLNNSYVVNGDSSRTYSSPFSFYTLSQIPDAYVNFADATSSHYKNKGIIWEVCNEPNLNDFWYNGNATTSYAIYSDILIRSSQKIKANDPTSFILGLCLAIGDDFVTGLSTYIYWGKYLENCLKLGVLDYIDGISFHPYKINDIPENFINTIYAQVKTIVNQYSNRDIPLFITENGYTTAVRSVVSNGYPLTRTDQEQADFYCRILLINDMLGIPLTSLFQWRDRTTDPNDVESNWGIIQNDYTPKAAQIAIKQLTIELNGYTYAERVNQYLGNDYILKYVDDKMNVKYVYWTTGTSHSVVIEGNTLSISNSPKYCTSLIKYENNTITTSPTVQTSKQLLHRYGLGTIQKVLDSNDSIGSGQTKGNVDSNGLYLVKGNADTPITDGILFNIGKQSLDSRDMHLFFDMWQGNMYARGWGHRPTGSDPNSWSDWQRFLSTSDILKTSEQTINLTPTGSFVRITTITILGLKIVNLYFAIPASGITALSTNLGSISADIAPPHYLQNALTMDGNTANLIPSVSISTTGALTLWLNTLTGKSGNFQGGFTYIR